MPSISNVERLEEVRDAQENAGTGLAAASMSGVELVAQSTAGIAPSAVMVSGATLVAASASAGTLYSYAVSLCVLLLVGWCVSRAARLRPGEDLLSHITAAFGRAVGFVGSTGLAFGYLLISVGCVAQFSQYVKPLLGVAPPASAGAPATSISVMVILEVVCVVCAAWMMIRGVRISAWTGVVLEVLSIGAILLVLTMVLIRHGVSLAPLMPTGITVQQVVSGMVLATLGFVGFESAACLSVEAKDPQRTIPRAVTGSALLAGALYLYGSYAQIVGFGGADNLAADATPLNTLADGLGMHWLGLSIDLGAVASNFACVAGSLTAASRVLRSMGESQLVHSKLAATHPIRKTPHVAIILLSAAALIAALGLGLSGINELDVYSYTGTMGTFGYMIAYMLMGLGIPILVRRLAPQTSVGIAAIIGLTVTCCLAYVFYRNVYPVPAWPTAVIPWIFLAVLLAAAAWYVAGPARVARRQTRESSVAAEPAPEPAR
ncbi:amino acid permease [Mycolicibacterium mucogenicum]|uniref:Amino acid permease n=1 Tax=Mycolicibacterium mucogenicum TaxID=56689 RepID=A0A1A3GKR0_MYCMU|nr:APC family permease [Mycolicibacterium mucogenicum]OBJ35969.1 amino acid permease [Mycolicibacterium mucogenicum]